jgi:hypothetical protein
VDEAGENVGQQVRKVGADGGDTAAQADVRTE